MQNARFLAYCCYCVASCLALISLQSPWQFRLFNDPDFCTFELLDVKQKALFKEKGLLSPLVLHQELTA